MTYRELQQEVKALREAGYVDVNLKSAYAVLVKAREEGLRAKTDEEVAQRIQAEAEKEEKETEATEAYYELIDIGEEITDLADKLDSLRRVLDTYMVGETDRLGAMVLREVTASLRNNALRVDKALDLCVVMERAIQRIRGLRKHERANEKILSDETRSDNSG